MKKLNVLTVAWTSIFIALASKILNPGWLIIVFGPFIIVYVILYYSAARKIKNMAYNVQKLFLRKIFFFTTFTFLLSFLLLPDYGDGPGSSAFFMLITFEWRSVLGQLFQLLALAFAAITAFACVYIFYYVRKNKTQHQDARKTP